MATASKATTTENATIFANDGGGAGAIEYRMPQGISIDKIEDALAQWQKFKQSFRIFIMAAGFEKLAETRKAAILLNCIGSQAQDLYFNVLKTEEKPKLDDVINIFDGYFKPKQNEVMNSFSFNKRIQEEGEAFDSFYTSLRKLGDTCNFGEQQDRMLRDRIVIGITDHRIQQRLLEAKDLTLEKAVDMCRSAELSKEHIKILHKSEVQVVRSGNTDQRGKPSYNRDKSIHNNNKFQNKFSNSNNLYLCKKCHSKHGPKNCPAYGKKCNRCNKFNHFSIGCKNSFDKLNWFNNNKKKDEL